MKTIKKIWKKFKKYTTNQYVKANFRFAKYYENTSVKDNIIIFQSYDGSSLSGNPYYILKEMSKTPQKYSGFEIYVACNSKSFNTINNIIKNENLLNAKTVLVHSKEYCKILTQAKYLINNSTFSTYFIKKSEQIYINTWHGTPLKAMGREIIDSPFELGNTQRNFMMADYLLFQNKFMFEKMKNAYMLDNLFKGKYIISGYPRNDIFYNKEDREKIKRELNIENKKVVVYMPTWRKVTNIEEQREFFSTLLKKLEENLDDDTVIFLKTHNLAKFNMEYPDSEKIKVFPDNYETYRFLNIADCLITDYSSVMFDYANTGKKIVLYTYDYDEYTCNRGFYMNVKDLPFEFAYNVDELCNKLKDLNNYKRYDEFMKTYCSYDSENTSKKICDYIFNNKNDNLEIIDGSQYNDGRENILIFTGALRKNGITTALNGLINNIDLDKYNYYLTFYRNVVRRNYKVINDFPEKCNYIPIQGAKICNYFEFLCMALYYKCNVSTKLIRRVLEKVYKREINRIYPGIKFMYAIDFCGYDRQPMNLISYMDAIKIRFTHSNMKAEQKTRKNFHVPSLKHAYRTYDKIAVVREGMKEEVSTHFKGIEPKEIKLVHNLNNIKKITDGSKEDIFFSESTYSNLTKEEIENIMNNKKIKKFINIGRFSKEKGQLRLLDAFNNLCKNNKDVYLILIGGHGNEFNKIMKKINEYNLQNVIVIKNMDNPYPILAKSDLFILSSFYEGLPMTIMESLILNVPILSVDIEGPRFFLEQGYAYIVENSTDGLLNGMKKFINNEYKELKKFDAEKFNEKAISEFNQLLDEEV